MLFLESRALPKTPPDPSVPPPLRALGGWLDADWFDPSILEEGEVVGISLPALPGTRKQSFELAERSVSKPVTKQRGAKAAPAPRPPPAGIGQILDHVGVLRAASFRRPRFFFQASPTLFFADIPAAKLKTRAADGLRRDLIRNALRGCVLSCRKAEVTVMAWPMDDAEVTSFVRAAMPPTPMHSQFDTAEAERLDAEPRRRGLGASAAGKGAEKDAAPRPTRAARAERDRLLAELDALRSRIVELQSGQSIQGAMQTLGLDDARLRSMLLLLHPDRHGNSEAANEAAKWVNGLRDLLRAERVK